MPIINAELDSFIGKAVTKLEKDKKSLNNCSLKLCEVFEKALTGSKAKNKSVVSRVKSSESLKEKIIRKPSEETTGEEYVKNLDDLIGVRILCLLNSEEDIIFMDLSKQVNFFKEKKLKIIFDPEKQPEVMKNGKKLYKIKGEIKHSGKNIKFELQIKSLINHLWGEVEHSSFYKGYNYTLSLDYHKKLMGNLYKHLEAVDKQLEFLSDHFESKEDKEKQETKEIICKLLSLKFSKVLNDKLGIVLDLREIFEVVVDCLIRIEGEGEIFKKISLFSSPIVFKNFEFNLLNNGSELDKIILSKEKDLFWKIFVSLLSTMNEEKFSTSFTSLLDKLIDYGQLEIENEIFEDKIKEFLKEKVEKALIFSFSKYEKISYLSDSSIILIEEVVKSYYDAFSEEIGELILEDQMDEVTEREAMEILNNSILYILDKDNRINFVSNNLTPENVEYLTEEIAKIRERG